MILGVVKFLPDPRVADWLLMQTPWSTLLLCVGYLAVCYLGPRLMTPLPPLELKPFLILYNFLMVLLSAYMFYEVKMNAVKHTKYYRKF